MSTLPTITGLGTTWWVEVFDEMSPEKSHIVYDDVRLFIAHFETRFSRFNPDSIISTLNAAKKFPSPDTETIALLEYGLQLFHDTDEVFNFLVGEAMEQQGYDALYSFTPKAESLTTPNPNHALFITQDKVILTIGQVDIGGYGKGYLLDLIAARLKEVHGLQYFLINGGGDMYATSEFGKPISIYLEHPTVAQTYLEQTTLFNEGFAASSTHKRRWMHENKVYTHIVDTKTGQSSDTSLAVFVKAPEAKLADAWATTLLLSAPENHLSKLREKNIKVAIFEASTGQLHYYHGF